MGSKGKSIKEKFREFLKGGHREKDLHYYLATSSGKPVGEQVPTLIGKRAAWASNQGASFIELAVENPSMILSDMDELRNSAKQLGLDYSVHSSTSIAFGATYMRGTRRPGFEPAQEYHRNLIIAVGMLKDELESTTDHTVTSINAHATTHPVPPEEERLANDVSVGPFGEQIKRSKIFESKNARLHIFEKFIRPMLEQEERLFQSAANELGSLESFGDSKREKILDELLDRGYLPQSAEELRGGMDSYDAMTEGQIRRFAFQNIPSLPEDHPQGPTESYPGISRDEYRSIRDECEEEAKEETYESIKEEVKESKENMIKLTNIRSIEEEINKESSVFHKVLPRWMPHAKQAPVRQLWEDITGLKSNIDPERAEKEMQDLKEEYRGPKKIVAASTAAIIWGQLTQIEDAAPGVEDMGDDSTLAEIMSHYGIQISFEAHMASAQEDLRLWVPADRLALSKAVNSTEIKGETHDICRITIDMEHLATNKIDPLWVIEGNDDQMLKGLDKGEGEYIRTIHVTHPYISEQGAGHEHGPIRRGDTLVFQYIYELVDRGFASRENEPAIIMYEIGSEQDESVFNLRLILDMIENGVIPEDLEVENIDNLMGKEPEDLRERLLQEFFGLSNQEMRHEWQSIHDHALDPLEGMLKAPKGSHTWEGRAALEEGSRPEEWQKEEYR